MKKIFHAKGNQKQAGVAILVSNKTNFKSKTVKRKTYYNNKGINSIRGHILNMYAPNTTASRYIKQILLDLKGEIDYNTIIVGDFTTLHSVLERSSRKKINKETSDLNYTLEQMDLTDIYKTFHLTAVEYTFFTSAYEPFSRINHMLGHRNKFQQT